MKVEIKFFGAPRVIIGKAQLAITFVSSTITLGEALEYVAATYPRTRPYLFDEHGRLPATFRIRINNIRQDSPDLRTTTLHDGDQVTLLVAIAGGS